MILRISKRTTKTSVDDDDDLIPLPPPPHLFFSFRLLRMTQEMRTQLEMRSSPRYHGVECILIQQGEEEILPASFSPILLTSFRSQSGQKLMNFDSFILKTLANVSSL